MKDKNKYFDFFFVFIIPLLSMIVEYITKIVNFQSFYEYIIYYIIGVIIFYIINMIRKRVFGIYFNSKKISFENIKQVFIIGQLAWCFLIPIFIKIKIIVVIDI